MHHPSCFKDVKGVSLFQELSDFLNNTHIINHKWGNIPSFKPSFYASFEEPTNWILFNNLMSREFTLLGTIFVTL